MNMTARLTEHTSPKALSLATDLELDRGQTLIGTPWTTEDLIAYGQSRKNFVFCYTDDLWCSNHYCDPECGDPLSKDYTGFEGETWCHYRVCLGLRYGIETDSEGRVIYRSKIIDHLTIDISESFAQGLEYLREVIAGLATRWLDGPQGKLVVSIDDRDTATIQIFEAMDFVKVDDVIYDGQNTVRMELTKLP